MADAPGGEVKVPGLGPVNKKALIIGGLAAGVVLVFLYVRRAKGSSSTGGSSTSAGIDPATGYPYGSAEDTAALSAQGAGSALDTGTANQLDSIDPSTGLTYAEELASQTSGSAVGGSILNGTGTGSGTAAPTTAAEWDSLALTNLENAGYQGHDLTTAQAGLGRYLAHLSLSAAQARMVQIAVGLTGPPPGGPYAIITNPGSPGGTTGTKVKVPNVVGQTVNAAHSALTSAGLAFNTDPAKDKPGMERKVTASHPKAGASVDKGTHVGLTWHYVKA